MRQATPPPSPQSTTTVHIQTGSCPPLYSIANRNLCLSQTAGVAAQVSGNVFIWEGPQRAKGHFKDYEVGANYIVLLYYCIVLFLCSHKFCGQIVCSH